MKNKIKYALLLISCLLVMGCHRNISGDTSDDFKKESVLPTDRTNIVQPVSSVYTSADLSKGIVKGDWAIEKVNGKAVIGEKAPFLKFQLNEGKVYGNNGCNVINADYEYNPADSTIRFNYLSSTMRLCHMEGITDTEINIALDAARRYTWSLSGDDFYIKLFNGEGEEVMELMHQNFSFLNGTWAVRQIQSEPVNVERMKIVIDVEEGKIHGNTGCNVFNGTLETNMEAPNSISFQSIVKTLMMCPDMEYETQLCVALEEAVKAKPLQGGKVELLDSQNKPVLLLERTSDK